MPSQIKVDEIKNVAGQYKIKTDTFEGQSTANNMTINSGNITLKGEGTATTNLQQGLCKQWCDWDTSGTIAIRDSFNTSSVVDFSSGYSENHYTTNFAHKDYAGSGSGSGSGNGSPAVMTDARSTKLTSENKIRHLHGATNGQVNPDDVMHIVHGDLA